MGLHTQQPDQAWISPILVEASHGTVRFTNPITAQPVPSQSCEKYCVKIAFNHTAQPTMKTDQPRNEPCLTLQKGIGWHDIAESQSCIRMTWSITLKSLNAWGHMHFKENDFKTSPQL